MYFDPKSTTSTPKKDYELSGRYTYSSADKIGEGVFAEVFRGYDKELKRQVAVKLLRPQFISIDDFRARFESEAKAAAGFSHPNIVEVYDSGEAPDGSMFIIMQFVEGRNLKEILHERRPSGFVSAEVIDIALQVCRALSAAHAKGIIHRDIKPQNIMIADKKVKTIHRVTGDPNHTDIIVDSEVNVLLTDFGIAKAMSNPNLTQAGRTFGTPAYMSPEQALGKPVSPASDIYALGCVMYEMLSGAPPFTGEDIEAMLDDQVKKLPRPLHEFVPGVPTKLEEIVMRCLCKEADQRYSSADQLASELKAVILPTIQDTQPTPRDSKGRATISLPPTERSGIISTLDRSNRPPVVLLTILAILSLILLFANFSLRPPIDGQGVDKQTATAASIGTMTMTSVPGTVQRIVSDRQTATAIERSATLPRDKVIKIVSSLPLRGASQPRSQDIVDAISMAIAEQKNQVLGFVIEYESWDDADDKGLWNPVAERVNAVLAANDPDIMIYIGPFNSGAAVHSIPILNKAGKPMISPSNTAPELTKPNINDAVFSTLYENTRNYFRLAPTDDIQGKQAANWARSLRFGLSKAYVLHDTSIYGQGIARFFSEEFQAIGGTVIANEGVDHKRADLVALANRIKNEGAEVVYFGGSVDSGGPEILRALRSVAPDIKFMGPDGIQTQQFIEQATPDLAAGTLATVPGKPYLEYGRLNEKRGSEFYDNFKRNYNREPDPYAIFGYEAAKVALKAIERAGSKNPGDIINALGDIRNYEGALGKWSFNSDGDVTESGISLYEVRNGKFEFLKYKRVDIKGTTP